MPLLGGAKSTVSRAFKAQNGQQVAPPEPVTHPMGWGDRKHLCGKTNPGPAPGTVLGQEPAGCKSGSRLVYPPFLSTSALLLECCARLLILIKASS